MTDKKDTMILELELGEKLIEMRPTHGEQRLPFMKEGDAFFLIFKDDTPPEKIEQVYDIIDDHLLHLQFFKHGQNLP